MLTATLVVIIVAAVLAVVALLTPIGPINLNEAAPADAQPAMPSCPAMPSNQAVMTAAKTQAPAMPPAAVRSSTLTVCTTAGVMSIHFAANPSARARWRGRR